MRAVLTTLVCLALLVGEVSGQMTQALRDTVLKEHNRLRRDAIGAGGPDEVSTVTATAMLEMEYDMKLECVAQAYIETQSDGFTHNSNRSVDYAACGGAGYVGENWYSGAPSTGDITGGATRAWVDFIWPVAWGGNGCSERQNYHETNCSGVDGHYTQVLWANTYKVGCGYTPAGGTVCNYSPGGNYTYQEPFVVGTACSACPDSHPYCHNGLCSKTNTPVCSADAINLTAADNDSNEIYISETVITAGNGFVVTAAVDVAFIAVSQISLVHGFSVESGAMFIAEMDPDANCTP